MGSTQEEEESVGKEEEESVAIIDEGSNPASPEQPVNGFNEAIPIEIRVTEGDEAHPLPILATRQRKVLLAVWVVYVVVSLIVNPAEALIFPVLFSFVAAAAILGPHLGRHRLIQRARAAVGLPFEVIATRWPRAALVTVSVAGLAAIASVIQTHNEHKGLRWISLVGFFVLTLFCTAISRNRKRIKWRLIVFCFLSQAALGFSMLKVPFVLQGLSGFGDSVLHMMSMTDRGSEILFGVSFRDHYFTFRILPGLIYFSVVSGLLYHLGILPFVCSRVAGFLVKYLGITFAEAVSTVANVFLGQLESPLLILPLVPTMTESEIHLMMTAGMATISGGMFSAYASMGIPPVHMLTASLMSAPAAMAASKLICPEEEELEKEKEIILPHIQFVSPHNSIFDCIIATSTDASRMAVQILIMLCVFPPLLGFMDMIASFIGSKVGLPFISFDWVCGYLLFPLAFIMGVPLQDCRFVGSLLGTKTIFNEFLAYERLSTAVKSNTITPRGAQLAIYALCGFSNIMSISILISGISAVAPTQRETMCRTGATSLVAGSVACFMTATMAGMLADT